jgi:hypothetical protein
VPPVAVQRRDQLLQEAALADAGRAGKHDSPAVVDERAQIRELGGASDQRPAVGHGENLTRCCVSAR